jgi:hypothetical protein
MLYLTLVLRYQGIVFVPTITPYERSIRLKNSGYRAEEER